MKKYKKWIIGAIIVVVLLFVMKTAVWAETPEACTATPSEYLVDTTQSITNNPDSSVPGGTWATDNYTRNIKIWAEDGHFCGTGSDNGTIETNGTISPQSGDPLPEVLEGTMTGGTKLLISGDFDEEAGDIPDLDCENAECGATGKWVDHYFTEQSYDYLDWGWTYKVCGHGTWVNANAGNSGDITAELTDEDCSEPTPPTTTTSGGGSPSSILGSTTNAPAVCSKDDSIETVAWANIAQGTPNDGTVEVQWAIPAHAEKVHIVYREDGRGWEHALLNAPNDGHANINLLKNGVKYWFVILGVKGCAVGQWSAEYAGKS